MFAEAYETAYRNALERLTTLDPEEVCRKCGCEYDSETYFVRYFNRDYSVSIASGTISPDDLKQGQRILMLHYLSCRESGHRKGEYVTYKGLPGGMFYNVPYRKRGEEWLLAAFSKHPGSILDAGRMIGGSPAAFGDVAVKLPVFPKIATIVVIHEGDDELPPELNILYPDSISDFLSLEDTAFLGGDIAGRLVRAKQDMRSSENISPQKIEL